MKKRAKIITTIASLSLAVALMAFGVYAATTATLGVSASVSFTATDVKIAWTGVASGGATGSETTVASDEQKSWTSETEGAATDSSSFAFTARKFLPGSNQAGYTISYTLTCTNNGLNSITVTPTVTTAFAETASSADTNMTVVYKQAATVAGLDTATAAAWSATTIAAGGSYVWFVSVSLDNATQDVTAGNELSASFAAARTAQG